MPVLLPAFLLTDARIKKIFRPKKQGGRDAELIPLPYLPKKTSIKLLLRPALSKIKKQGGAETQKKIILRHCASV